MNKVIQRETSDAPKTDAQDNRFASMADVLARNGSIGALEDGIFARGNADEDESALGSGADEAAPETVSPEESGEDERGEDAVAPSEESDEEVKDDPLQSRFDELTGQREHYRRKLESEQRRAAELESRLQALESGGDTGMKPNRPEAKVDPFDGITTLKDLDARVAEMENQEDWAEEQIEALASGEVDEVEWKGRIVGVAELKSMRREARQAQRAARSAEARITEAEKLDEVATETYPWLSDPESREAQIHSKLMEQQFPQLRGNPAARLAVADMMVGMAARLKGSPKGGGAGVAASPKGNPAPAKAPSSGAGKMNGVQSASELLANGGTRSRAGRKAPPAPPPTSPAASGGSGQSWTDSKFAKSGSERDLASMLLGED